MTCLSRHRVSKSTRSSLWRPTWSERWRVLFGARVEVATDSHMGMRVEVVRPRAFPVSPLTGYNHP